MDAVCFILESGSTVFNPYSKEDELRLEKVQAMFAKRITETPDRLSRKRELGLDSLVLRRHKADMKPKLHLSCLYVTRCYHCIPLVTINVSLLQLCSITMYYKLCPVPIHS